MPGQTRYVFERGELVVDDRYFPVVIATWKGEVSHDSARAYYAWLDEMIERAAAEGIRLENINDVLDMGRIKSVVLSVFVEESNRLEFATQHYGDYIYVVARRAFFLGLVAAVLRRIRRGIRLSSTDSISTAIERALRRLDDMGVARPEGLSPSTYERPRFHRAVA